MLQELMSNSPKQIFNVMYNVLFDIIVCLNMYTYRVNVLSLTAEKNFNCFKASVYAKMIF